MPRRHPLADRVTLALRLADASLLPLVASADSLRFIGRYSRLTAFGPIGRPLDAHLVGQAEGKADRQPRTRRSTC
jgi:hypothetical protein